MPVPLTPKPVTSRWAEPGLEITSVVPAPQTGPGWGTPRGSPLTAPGLEEMSGTKLRNPVPVRVPVAPLWHKTASFVPEGGHGSPPASPRRGGKRAVPRDPQGPACGAALLPAAPRDLAASSPPTHSWRTKTVGTSSRQGWEP